MTTREEALAFGLSYPDTCQDAPFHDPNWQLVRIKSSKKVFLWTYEKDGYINLNVKADPEWRDYWRSAFASVTAGYHLVNVVPKLKAGGSFATAVYAALQAPVAVEAIQAHAGIDIGDTLIGMHLRPVAVPVRIGTKQIGEAHVVCARTRLKFIGGERASYLENEK